MATTSGSFLRFPDNYKPDNEYVLSALKTYLSQAGYGSHCTFADLTTREQRTVLVMAQKLKQREGEQ